MRRACVLLVCLAPLAGCPDSRSPTELDGRLRFSTVAQTRVAGVAGPQIQAVVRDPEDWTRIWSELWGGRPPTTPPIDFGRDVVVVVTGSEICFGWATIEEIRRSGGSLRVNYADAAPSLCLCAQPELAFHAVRLERSEGTPSFVARVTPPLCPA